MDAPRSNNRQGHEESFAPLNQIPNPDNHYLERVSAVGEQETVIASADIYSKQGVLLLRKGTAINRKSFVLLSKHKLAKRVDDSLAVAELITDRTLFFDAKRELNNDPLLKVLLPFINNPLELENCIRHLPLSDVMRTKVSMGKKSSPESYRHSLRVALGAAMLGFFQGLPQSQCEHLAAAGLFHDLGMLHIDRQYLDPSRVLNAEEMRFVHSHPVIMYLLLRDSEVYHPHISVPVLEHHERRGGNGYPKGLEQFSSPLSSVLALAEVVVSLSERCSLDHVLEVVKIQQDMFDPATVKALFSVTTGIKVPPQSVTNNITEAEYLAKIDQFDRIGRGWLALMPEVEAMAEREPTAHKLLRWMQMLERMLIRTGVDMAHIEQLRDPMFKEYRQEYVALLNEGLYHINQIVCAVSHFCVLHPKSLLATNQALSTWLADCDRELQTFWRERQGQEPKPAPSQITPPATR